ncbi:type IV secretion system DNA-binding domain-containing protein [Mucilaginibacter sp. AK015]|uniref:type IV secretion system DNA-binding domain-containing protein n=1 Tax=Mucilaginibacter sp. AK015 TaxID=2723072 RepID=UPI001620AD5C|nr:type IV secretion system DNA-binding domain-containing protein [Mucilaginibacter sp. AK015]MBB5397178.1 putative ATPase [Mucilaginibacter sp. AK015]
MNNTLAHALTQQFYEWERRGRGWHKAAFPCDLEPPFEPFFGHFVENVIIDDGRKPTWLSELFNPSKPIAPLPPKDPSVEVYPFTDTSPVQVFVMHLSERGRPSAERMEQLLTMLSYRKSPISFELVGSHDAITVQWACRAQDALFVQTQVQAFFPECALVETHEDKLREAVEAPVCSYIVDFGLRDEFLCPIATAGAGDTDPYTAFIGIASRLHHDEHIVLQVLFSGTHNAWAQSIMTAACDDSMKQSFFFDAPEMPQMAKEKVSRPLFGATVRLYAAAEGNEKAQALLQYAATALVHLSTSQGNALLPLSDAAYCAEERISDMALRQSHRLGMLLNARELATLAHIPAIQLSSKLIANHRSTKRAPAAACIDQPYCLGLNSHQGTDEFAGIDAAQRLRHMHIIGATGTGKSTLLHSLIMQDIHEGAGICVIDPHGDLIDGIIHAIPAHRISDVVLIDPTDGDHPIGLNILRANSDVEKELLASDLVALFRRFSTSWGDQMNSVFANAISAFVYNTTVGTIGDLRKFLIEPAFRTTILATCTDPDIAYYWQKEYPILKSSSIGSILTRLDSFLRPKVIRNMVCQEQCLNFQELMDSQKIILVKLSQGLLGEENSYLLGAFIVSKLQQTAMARQAQDRDSRIPFYCYIDEFQHFVTPSMASILSGARKYGLGLILAHQDMQQVSRVDADIAASVLANAGTRICFRLGDTDAKRMQEGFAAFTADDLQSLATGDALVRVNTRDQDFNITVLPFEDNKECGFEEAIIEYSRAAYGVPVVRDAQAAVPQEPPTPPAVPATPAVPSVQEEPKQQELREHRYLQTFIKKLAEEYGYTAHTEAPTPDSKGQVDVLLEKEGVRIAVEISVSTSAQWELHNIQKCLAAGYEKIAVCTTMPSKMKQIQALVRQHIPLVDQVKIHIISPEQLQQLFVQEPPKHNAATVLKGYRVKVQYEQSSDKGKSDILNRILNTKKF